MKKSLWFILSVLVITSCSSNSTSQMNVFETSASGSLYAEKKDFDSLLKLASSVKETYDFLTLEANSIIEEMITWQTIETEDGKIYYHNTMTDETAWEIPEIMSMVENLQKCFVGGGMLKHEKLEKLETI